MAPEVTRTAQKSEKCSAALALAKYSWAMIRRLLLNTRLASVDTVPSWATNRPLGWFATHAGVKCRPRPRVTFMPAAFSCASRVFIWFS